MTKKEFKKYEELCKKGWLELAETGERHKPDYFSKFLYSCTACHLACSATMGKVLPLRINTNRGVSFLTCKLCPVTKWRAFAVKYNLDEEAACEYLEFRDWRTASSILLRKMYAQTISELEWKYLPEYEEIEKENTSFKKFEIHFSDLTKKAQDTLCSTLGISFKNTNWDVFPITEIVIEEEGEDEW